jgi:hypothetical protein
MKTCRDCGQTKPLAEMQKHPAFKDGHNTLCSECNRRRVKEWRKKNPEKRALQAAKEGKQDYVKNKHLKRDFGITLDEYNVMFEQQEGCCKICKRHQVHFSRRLAVDHCHSTGKIRGLLCSQCNTLLGMAKDDTLVLQEAINYLTGY